MNSFLSYIFFLFFTEKAELEKNIPILQLIAQTIQQILAEQVDHFLSSFFFGDAQDATHCTGCNALHYRPDCSANT